MPESRKTLVNPMNKRIIQLVLAVAVIAASWYLVHIIMEPITFNKEKAKRYDKVQERMYDIREAQKAFKEVNGFYAGKFDQLIGFLDTGDSTIVQRRDTSFLAYDPVYRTDLLKDSIVIDTLGYVSIKDSIYANDFDLNKLPFIPGADGAKFEMQSGFIERQGYKVPVLQVKADKNVILDGLSKQLIKGEDDLILGSLSEASLSGNW